MIALISMACDGTQAQGWEPPSISADGRYVASNSSGGNLVPGGGISSIESLRQTIPASPAPPAPASAVILVETLGVEGYFFGTGDVVPLGDTANTDVVVNRRASANTPARWALFSAASGDEASVVLQPIETLPGVLPVGYTYMSAVSVRVIANDEALAALSGGKTLTLSFAIPQSFFGRSFAIFYWDAALGDGLGGWVKLNIVVRYRSQVTVTADWLPLPMTIVYWDSAAKFGLGDWIELPLTASYNPADGWIELPATASESLLTLTNADSRALATVNFTGMFALAAW